MPVATPGGFDLSSGPRCVSCSCRIDSERYALECVAERSTTCDPGGDLVQRLRLKNRQLEKDLASLAALREEHYAKKTREVEEHYKRMFKEREEEKSAWYVSQREELMKLRSGAVLMYNLQKGKRIMLGRELQEQKVSFESRVQELLAQIERGRADHQKEVATLMDEHSKACSLYEARITALEERKNLAEDRCRRLEEQVEKQHAELKAVKGEKETMHQDLLRVQKSLAESEQTVEMLRADSQVKAIKHRARLDKSRLEAEVMDYVKYIVSTPERGDAIPDLPSALWLPLDALHAEQNDTSSAREPVGGRRNSASGHRNSLRHDTVTVNYRAIQRHDTECDLSAPPRMKTGTHSRPLRPMGEQVRRAGSANGISQAPARNTVPVRRAGSARSAR